MRDMLAERARACDPNQSTDADYGQIVCEIVAHRSA